MPLQPMPISWPITGALDTKKSPLMMAPGSHLVIDNLRQERLNEWRARSGFTHNAADDVLGGHAPVRCQPLIGGGGIAMDRQTGNASAFQTYIPSLAANRWTRASNTNASQSTPGHWTRTPVSRAKDDAPLMAGFAASSTFQLIAHWGQTGGVTGVYASIQSVAEGQTLPADTLISATGSYPRCVFNPASNLLCLFWLETATNQLKLSTWNGSTGAPVATAGVIVSNVNLGGNMDAYQFSGARVTVMYRSTTASHLVTLEVDPSTFFVATNVDLGIAADVSINLMPDPDGGAKRFVAVAGGGSTRVVTVDASGTIFTNDVALAGTAINAAGVAYNTGSGALDWLLVMQQSFNIIAIKKRGGVVGASKTILGVGAHTIDSGAWREPGTDLMRVVLGLHRAIPDFQSTYYEKALEFENGSTSITDLFPEPQARILPLNAGQGQFGFCHQVQRLSTDKYGLALMRLARISFQGNQSANQYAMDSWTVEYANDTNRTTLNVGPGLMTAAGSFLPAGSLLQSNTGGALWAHGMSAIPFQPSLLAGAGGSLTPNSQYQYMVSIDAPDEAGNVWPGPTSIPATMTAATMGANNQITVTVTVIPTENTSRPFTYKIWRTKANGSAFQLVNSRTGTVASLGTSFTYVDQTSDAILASGDFLTGEVQPSVTPSFIHTAFFNGRIYGVERDFRTRLWFSKPIVAGRAPEFMADQSFQLDITDEFGAFTNLAALDGTLVAFKGSNGTAATYAIQGDGPGNDGSGSLPAWNRISSDSGSILGTPVISTGDEAYFLSLLGVYRITRSLTIDFVGMPLDQFFNQPTVQAPETLLGAVYDRETNEVRLSTTSYRLVFNRIWQLWTRDTGGMPGTVMTRAFGQTQVLFRSNGQMWAESATASDDAGTTYQGSIRSAWVRAAQFEGRFRLYRARVLCTRTVDGLAVSDPRLTIAFDNDDTLTETFAPLTAIQGSQTLVRFEAGPRKGISSAFTLQLTFPVSDLTFRIEQWGVVVGMLPGPQPLVPSTQRWS